MKFLTYILVFSLFCACSIRADIITSAPVDELMSAAPELTPTTLPAAVYRTPDIVPESEFPTPDIYWIRTRVIIETVTATIPISNDNTTDLTLRGQTALQVEEYFKVMEEAWSDLNIKFYIEQYVFFDYQGQGVTPLWVDAIRYQNYLSVYFLLPRKDTPYSGLSSGPWETLPWGILMFNGADKWTLAHEFGHYLGLLHPFEITDFVDDTPSQQRQLVCTGTAVTSNCGNLMIYCNHFSDEKFPVLTEGQRERALRFLRASRRNHIVPKPPDRPLDLYELVGLSALIQVH